MLRRRLPIPIRVILRPLPQTLTLIRQRPRRLPAQLLLRPVHLCREVKHVTGTALDDLVGEFAANGFVEGGYHFEDGGAHTGAEVPGAHAGMHGPEVVEGCQVASREVFDVEVVADGGAVFGVVVCREVGGNVRSRSSMKGLRR